MLKWVSAPVPKNVSWRAPSLALLHVGLGTGSLASADLAVRPDGHLGLGLGLRAGAAGVAVADHVATAANGEVDTVRAVALLAFGLLRVGLIFHGGSPVSR